MLTDKKILKLESLGFQKKWLGDKSGYWYEKKGKMSGFNIKFVVEEYWNIINIECFTELSTLALNRKQYEAIWQGSFNQLIKKYNNLK